MRLASAATRFDKTVATDAYNPLTTFKCQLAPHDLFKVDSTAVSVRSMSCAPSISMPARGVIAIDGERFLVGKRTADFWNGAAIRHSYVIQGAESAATLISIGDALLSVAGVTAYVSLDFNKNQTDERTNSTYHSQYNIFLGGAESVASLINIGTRWFHVRQAYVSVSGLLVTLANEIEGTVFETVNFGATTYNPVIDAKTTVTTSIKVLRILWTEDFAYLSQGTAKFENGDMVVMTPKTVSPKAGDTLALSDGNWRILNALDRTTYWSCHVRR